MNNLTSGKGGEFIIAGKLLFEGLEVFLPVVDVGIDIIVRKQRENGTISYYELQVKTMSSYTRILGVKEKDWFNAPETRILIIYYHHNDEFYFLTPDQVCIPERLIPNSERGDFRFTEKDRDQLKNQNLQEFVKRVNSG